MEALVKDHIESRKKIVPRANQTIEMVKAETIKEEIECRKCAGFFDATTLIIAGQKAAQALYCAECYEEMMAERQALEDKQIADEKEAIFQKRWETIPARYREPFDIETLIANVKRLHLQDQQKGLIETDFSEVRFRRIASEVINFPLEAKGLALIGRTRRGKTRMLIQLLERCARAGDSFEYINMSVWGTQLSAMMGEDMAKANRSIERLCSVKRLLMDDLGKQRNTERIMSELYRIIETRTNEGLSIYFSANEKGDELISKMRTQDGEISDCAEPIVERLREFCVPYAL